MAEAYIIDAVRTPRGIGKQGKGALAHMHPQHLASTCLKAIKDRFAGEGYQPYVGSTKSLTGHAVGAAGVHEAIYSLIMLNKGFLAESANINELVEEADEPAVAAYEGLKAATGPIAAALLVGAPLNLGGLELLEALLH